LKHIAEDDLIAYQMNESDHAAAIAQHLELCRECARTAESIAETLRVFSAEPVPLANLDHAWQRLRGSLPALTPTHGLRRRWGWLAIPAAAGLVSIAFLAVHPHPPATHPNSAAKLAPGPLTLQPRDPDLATHLDSAERLLTEVNHSSGPLDETTRREAHELLLSNALYIRKADADGDVVDSAVLEDLSRTLTTLEHETGPEKTREGWHLSFQMDTHGLLLDLRILEQNDKQQNDNASTKESK
jgi:hypothetical protein